MGDISNYDSMIGKRDIDARIAEIESEIETASEMGVSFEDLDGLYDVDPDAVAELYILRKVASEAGTCRGDTLISDRYFQEYAESMVEDVESVDLRAWPFNHIDWSAAADSLRSDYTSIDFDGETYWISS